MDEAKLMILVSDAKDMHDHGKFGPLQQVDFFKAMEEAMSEEPPADPPVEESPPEDPPPEG